MKEPQWPNQWPMNNGERKAMEYILVCTMMMNQNEEAIKERLKTLPGAWRDYRLMQSLGRKLYRSLSRTLTDLQFQQFSLLEKHGECKVSMHNFSRNEEFRLVHIGCFDTVVSGAIAGICELCIKDEKEIRKCKLKKALEMALPPKEIPRFGCAYRLISSDPNWKKTVF